MKPEIETTIRTIAQSDGIPEERIDAGIAAMKMGTEQEVQEPLFSLKKITPLVGLGHYGSLSRLKVQRVGISYGGRLSYRLSDVVRYLRSSECTAIREELRRKRRMWKGGKHAAVNG